jgi:DNA-binding CsgD family transcriptional regulator
MLVGRDAESAILDALFRDCARGTGTVLVIRGPVAAGKTALLRAFADRVAGEGAIYLGAAGSRSERGLPLGIARQLFGGRALPSATAARSTGLLADQALTGQLAADPAPAAVSPALARVFDGLVKVLVELSEDGPVVIAVDDAQYTDVVSLHGLSYLVRRVAALPVLVALADCPQRHPGAGLLQADIVRHGNSHCLPLAPLPPSGVGRLLAQYLDSKTAQQLAPACHAITGGNPALVNALGEDSRPVAGSRAGLVPGPAFRAAVVACLNRHEPGVTELGQAVAVLGEDATVSLLAELLAVSPDSVEQGIDALSASGLLEAGCFRHDQARQAVLGQLTPDERASMHGSAAGKLHHRGAPPATLARHLTAAHRSGTRWSVTALHEAAEQALADGEANRGLDYLRRAERECADDRQHATIRFSLARAEWAIDPECAARHLPLLVGDARTGLLDSKYLGDLAYYLLWAGHTSDAAEILCSLGPGSADAACGPAGFAVQTMTIRSPLDFLYPDLAKRARQLAQDANGSVLVMARPRLAPVYQLPSARKNDGAILLTVAERILSERSRDDPTLAASTTALMALICDDMLDRAASWCDTLLRESQEPRDRPFWHAVFTSFWAMIQTRWGNLPAAENYSRTALSLLSKKAWGVAIGGPLSTLLIATTASRNYAEAAACLQMPVPDAMFGTFYGLLYLCARGEYYLATERPNAALTDFTDCGNRMTAWGLDLPGLVPWRTKAAEAHLAMGDSRAARELVQEQLSRAGSEFSRTRGMSLRALALASHPAERTALLRESAEVLRAAGDQLELARTFTELSNAHLALGESGRAHWAARQARALTEQCGAQPLPVTPEKIDPDPREAVSSLFPQLSDAERRVAILAADGYTNCQIASRLYITVSTVEQHLTRVYRKLGVSGRAALPIEI